MRLGETSVGTAVYIPFRETDAAQTGSGAWVDLPWTVVHRGKPDVRYDDSFLGGTVLMLAPPYRGYELSVRAASGTGKCDYGGTKAHNADLVSLLDRMEPALGALVRRVKLPCRAGITGNTVLWGPDGLEAALWLPSAAEIARDPADCWIAEGAQFDFWKNSSAELYQSWKTRSVSEDNPGYWFTRTPCQAEDNLSFMVIMGETGDAGKPYAPSKNAENTVNGSSRPCMVMPDEVTVDPHGRLTAAPTVGCKTEGVWKEGLCRCKTDGVWREAAHISCRVGGVWKE